MNKEKETEEMANAIAKICPDKVDDYCSCSGGTPCYVCLSKALIDLGYRKVKPIIIKINDKVEVHCDTMEDYDEFLKELQSENKSMEFNIDYQGSIDDISEITITYKKPISPLYAIVRYCCQRNKPYKILQYSIIGKDILNGKDKRLWEWYPSMNFSLIEDGFTNEYDARARLKELQGWSE